MHALLGGCLTRTGRMQQALAFLVPPGGATIRQGSTVLSEPWSPFGNQVLALIGLGRLGEAEEFLTAAQQELRVHDVSPESAIVAASLAALRLEQGRVQAAFLQATSAAAVFLDLSLPLCARWCEALSANALALAGVAPKATQTLSALDALGLPTDMQYEVEVLQARAWAWAAGGDMGAARQCLQAAVDLGQQTGDLLGATRALHGMARMGRAPHVVDVLGALASKVDGELTAARLSYTTAAADKDSQGLAAAAERFEQLGALLYAAEALGESAVHLRRDGSSQTPRRRSRRPVGFSPAAKAPSRPSCGPSGAGPAHPGRTRHGAAGRDRELRQADRRGDASFGAHGGEPPAPRLPEARALAPTRAGGGAAGSPRDLICNASLRRALRPGRREAARSW